MSNPILTFGLRGAQILFSVVALGLSVGLMKAHKLGSLPATLGFSVFVTAASLLGAFVGLASAWVELLQGVIGAAVDGVVLLGNIAAGILIAYKMRGTNCTKKDIFTVLKLNGIELLNGGFYGRKNDLGVDITYWGEEDPNKLYAHCKEAQADAVFMFLTVVILIAALTMTFLHLKR